MKPFLEIGAHGGKFGPDWMTFDIDYEADVRGDLTKTLPFGDDCFEIVYLSHVLEHIPWYQTVDVLKELHRILKPGGRVEVHVPDFAKIVDGYRSWPKPVEGGEDWWTANDNHDPGLWLNGRLMRGPATPGEPEHYWHRTLFDRQHLENCLERAGFKAPVLLGKPRGHDHGWINLGMSALK